MKKIQLVLTSHTNAGKTTLMRTLLRKKVGIVEDGAHTTDEAEAHTLLQTETAKLILWDTPGFGNVPAVIKEIKKPGKLASFVKKIPGIPEFLKKKFDKYGKTERSLYCSQKAVQAAWDEADLMLYLADISQDPGETGYLDYDLEILGLIGKPALLILNHIRHEDITRVAARWSSYCGKARLSNGDPLFRGGAEPLNAFTRCWTQEHNFLEAAKAALGPDYQSAMSEILKTWRERHLTTFHQSARIMAEFLRDAANCRETARGLYIKKKIAKEKWEELGNSVRKLIQKAAARLIEAHELTGKNRGNLKKAPAFDQHDNLELGWTNVAAALAGAAAGIGIDLIAGAATLWIGTAICSLMGAITGGVLTLKGEYTARLNEKTLCGLTEQILLVYFAISHHGFGQGFMKETAFDAQTPEWGQLVGQAVTDRKRELNDALSALMQDSPGKVATENMAEWIERAIRQVLTKRYPESQGLFRNYL